MQLIFNQLNSVDEAEDVISSQKVGSLEKRSRQAAAENRMWQRQVKNLKK